MEKNKDIYDTPNEKKARTKLSNAKGPTKTMRALHKIKVKNHGEYEQSTTQKCKKRRKKREK